MEHASQLAEPRRRIWYGVVGAPAAWGAQLIVGWLLTTLGCLPGSQHGFSVTRSILIALDVAALLVSVGALLVGWGAWRACRESSITRVQAAERPEFLAAVALIVSSIFTVAVIWEAVPTLVLPVCVTER